MTTVIGIPPALAGQPLEPCAVAVELAGLLGERNLSASDVLARCLTDRGELDMRLADEFAGAVGYRYDWGWVIPGHAPGHDGCFWRFVPVALWSELRGAGQLHDTVPRVLDRTRRYVIDYVSHASQGPSGPWTLGDPWEAPYGCLERALLHDMFSLQADDPRTTTMLVRWLETDFLPRHMAKLLRLLKAAVLAEMHRMQRASSH